MQSFKTSRPGGSRGGSVQTVLTRFVSFNFLRGLIAMWLAGAFGIFAFAATMGLRASSWVALLVGVGVAVIVLWASWNRSIVPLDKNAATSSLKILFVLGAILSLIQLARLCVFIVNPAAVGYALG